MAVCRAPPGLRSRPACLSSAAGRSHFGGVGCAVHRAPFLSFVLPVYRAPCAVHRYM